MNILAIDPGNVQSAYVLWDGERIVEKAIADNDSIRKIIGIMARCPDSPLLAIEQIKSYGMSVGESIFETCVWTGRFMQTWIDSYGNELGHQRIPRLEVKMHLCHTPRATDGNIRQALIDRLGAPGTKKRQGATYGVSKDIWSALAVAVCAYDRLENK